MAHNFSEASCNDGPGPVHQRYCEGPGAVHHKQCTPALTNARGAQPGLVGSITDNGNSVKPVGDMKKVENTIEDVEIATSSASVRTSPGGLSYPSGLPWSVGEARWRHREGEDHRCGRLDGDVLRARKGVTVGTFLPCAPR